MASSLHSEDSAWAIESIPVDDAGFAFYLSEYKPFRLTALRQDPDGTVAYLDDLHRS